MHDATAAPKSPEKFDIFHDRHVWKSSSVNERTSPAKNSVIATSHPKQEARVMRKGVGQSVYGRCGRQADPKETAADFWIAHYARDLIQGFQRHFGVCVQKPENFAACSFGSGVHLSGTAARAASDNVIAQAFRHLVGAVSAPAIDYDNFRPTRSLA